MKTIVLTILIFRVFLTSLHGQSGNNVFDNEYLHEICIYFPDTSYWESLVSNYQDAYSFSGSDMEYLAADILIDNNLLDSVGIRLRGKT